MGLQTLIHSILGAGAVKSVQGSLVQILFPDGKVRTFYKDCEHLQYPEDRDSFLRQFEHTYSTNAQTRPQSRHSSADARREALERSRSLSKYCTDFKGNRELFEADFDENRNPAMLAELEKQASSWFLIVGCGPTGIANVYADLGAHGLEWPERYVRHYPNGHVGKYDLMVPDPGIPNVDRELGIYFGWRALYSTGRYQLSKKEFVLRNLMRIGRILKIGE